MSYQQEIVGGTFYRRALYVPRDHNGHNGLQHVFESRRQELLAPCNFVEIGTNSKTFINYKL